jgi:hypothetical protein
MTPRHRAGLFTHHKTGLFIYHFSVKKLAAIPAACTPF